MNSLLIFIIGIVLIGLLLPKSVATPTVDTGRVRLPFWVFVLVLAFSPVLGALFAITIGIEFSTRVALCFSWVGVAASLPLALLFAKLLGQDSYTGFWRCMEESFKIPRSRVKAFWLVLSMATFVIGILVFVLSVVDSTPA